MTLKAVESLAQTEVRGYFSDYDESSKILKKRRSSGSDTLQYLREKAKSNKELQGQELELLRQEISMQQCIISTGTTAVTTNYGNNATVVTCLQLYMFYQVLRVKEDRKGSGQDTCFIMNLAFEKN